MLEYEAPDWVVKLAFYHSTERDKERKCEVCRACFVSELPPPPSPPPSVSLSCCRHCCFLFVYSLFFIGVSRKRIPADMEYTHEMLPSLSAEELEKLRLVRPETFAVASQMQGMTPHSLVYLYNHVTRRCRVSFTGEMNE